MPTVRYTVMDGEVMSEKRGAVERDYVPDPLGKIRVLQMHAQFVVGDFVQNGDRVVVEALPAAW